jgi:hypothetical protein
MYAIDKPFRNIISFCMGKDESIMKSIINATIKTSVTKYIKN